MSCNCCNGAASGNNKPPARATCPGCQQPAGAVSTTTLLHQLQRPWQQAITERPYYFCQQPGCEVVYFDDQGGRFNTDALRQLPGQKSTSATRTLCYCFDICYNDIEDAAAEQRCRDFVTEMTRNKLCSCETHNPSGRCCLRDFPKPKE